MSGFQPHWELLPEPQREVWPFLAPSVKLGDIGIGRIGKPELTQDGVVKVASLADLLATKLKVILQRIEAKDYQDIAAILRSGELLESGLAGASALYSRSFQPSEALKALTYFEGGDLAALPVGSRGERAHVWPPGD